MGWCIYRSQTTHMLQLSTLSSRRKGVLPNPSRFRGFFQYLLASPLSQSINLKVLDRKKIFPRTNFQTPYWVCYYFRTIAVNQFSLCMTRRIHKFKFHGNIDWSSLFYYSRSCLEMITMYNIWHKNCSLK